METPAIISKLNRLVPGAVLQRANFGRDSGASVWIEVRSLEKVAVALKADDDLRLDWLENLSVAQLDQSLVLTYFVRSRVSDSSLILRMSESLEADDEWIEVPTVRHLWAMAAPMEDEARELFGIRFLGVPEEGPKLLPKGWRGFPLRKTYVFPQEFFEIPHGRGRPQAAAAAKSERSGNA